MIKLSFIFIVFIFISSKEPLGIENNVDTKIVEQELLPLSIGNKWFYVEKIYDDYCTTETISDYTLEITKTDKFKGNLWYKIEKSNSSFIEHYYRVDEYGVWYRIPQYFPNESFLILNYQKNTDDRLYIKDIFTNNKNYNLELVLIDKNKEIFINNIKFICYQYNINRININTNETKIFKECFYAKGIGLVLENEYKDVNNKQVLSNSKSLNTYNLVNN